MAKLFSKGINEPEVLSLVEEWLELARALRGLDDELAFIPLIHQAGVDELAHEVGSHGALLVHLLELRNLQLELGDLELLGSGLGFLVGGFLLFGLDLCLVSSALAAHLEHVGGDSLGD